MSSNENIYQHFQTPKPPENFDPEKTATQVEQWIDEFAEMDSSDAVRWKIRKLLNETAAVYRYVMYNEALLPELFQKFLELQRLLEEKAQQTLAPTQEGRPELPKIEVLFPPSGHGFQSHRSFVYDESLQDVPAPIRRLYQYLADHNMLTELRADARDSVEDFWQMLVRYSQGDVLAYLYLNAFERDDALTIGFAPIIKKPDTSALLVIRVIGKVTHEAQLATSRAFKSGVKEQKALQILQEILTLFETTD